MKLLFIALLDANRQLRIMRNIHRFIRLSDVETDNVIFGHANAKHRLRERMETDAQLNLILSIGRNHDLRNRSQRLGSIGARTALIHKDKSLTIQTTGGLVGEEEKLDTGSFEFSKKREMDAYDGDALLQQVQSMMSTRFTQFGIETAKHGEHMSIPHLNFRAPENVTSWTYLRLIFQHFGDRFRTRIDLYTGTTIPIVYTFT